jgi:hypothetical protein
MLSSIQTCIWNINIIPSIASFLYVLPVIVSNIIGWLDQVNGSLYLLCMDGVSLFTLLPCDPAV